MTLDEMYQRAAERQRIEVGDEVILLVGLPWGEPPGGARVGTVFGESLGPCGRQVAVEFPGRVGLVACYAGWLKKVKEVT